MSLDDLRKRIDDIDDQLVDLLEARAALAAQAAAHKRQADSPIHDPDRERQVFAHVERALMRHPNAQFPATSLRPVFREIMSGCLATEQPLRVAYMGPPGTFSHMAAQAAFGLAAHYVQTTNIPAVLDAVARGGAEYGVVPFENSTEGGINATLDTLLESELLIRSELVLEVVQCLAGRHDDLARIQRVYSHPQPLAQCREWLTTHLPHAQLVVSPSTVMAAREAAEDDTAAAVCSRLAAELTELRVIQEGIQDRAENATRFVVVARSDGSPTGRDKTTFVFATHHERGALRKALEILEHEGINLTRIESRPRRGKLWEYVFFADVEGHRVDPNVARALALLDEHSGVVRVLGSYPAAR